MTNDDLLAELRAEAAEAAAEPTPADKLERMTALAARAAKYDAEIADLTARLADATQKRNALLQGDMLAIMDEAKTPLFERDGLVFSTDIAYHASIPKGEADAGCDLLETERCQAGDLVKREIVVVLPKDAQKQAAAIVKWITQRYQQATVEQKRSVPWARLTSWYKERVQKGDVEFTPEDLKLLGASHYRYVKVAEAAAAKSKKRGG